MSRPTALILAALGIGIAASASPAVAGTSQTLTTRDHVVRITERCPEGDVGCTRVSYRGTDRHTGATIRLTGRALTRPCADGVTPCAFLSYEFRNGSVRYTVTAGGVLIVRAGGRVIARERGRWS